MRKCMIGICDKDVAYVVSIQQYLRFHKKRDIECVVFTEMKAVEEFLKNETLNILLTDDISLCGVSESGDYYFAGIFTVKLKQNRYDTDPGIVKYQAVEELFKEALSLCKVDTSKRINRLIAIYSPIGRCGKTTLAMAFCRADEVRGGLYFGLEDYTEYSSNILYQIIKHVPDIEKYVANEVRKEQSVDVIYGTGIFIDTRNVNASDLVWFANKLFMSGMYSTICVDIGTGSLPDLESLRIFDRIFVPKLDNKESEIRIKRFKKVLIDMGLQDIHAKLEEIQVPCNTFDSPEMQEFVNNLEE